MTSARVPAGHVAPLVLIVEDSEDNRAMYAEYLLYSGYRVEEASNGEDGVSLTERLKPDVIVMDVSLPVVDGWEATRRLKADGKTKHIPVIVLTGSDAAHGSACDAYLAKPCLPEELVAKIEELIGA